MKYLNRYINIRKGKSTIEATNDTIRQIVKGELDKLGHDADLNHIDVSEVTDMYRLFSCHDTDLGEAYKDLNPDISKWNVRNTKNMRGLFSGCKMFNSDISEWDVSNVIDMTSMFYRCENFNQDLSRWVVSKVRQMKYMFYKCKNFNSDISRWDVSKVENMTYMFYDCDKFNQDISAWNRNDAKLF